jgi:hypothetical protein
MSWVVYIYKTVGFETKSFYVHAKLIFLNKLSNNIRFGPTYNWQQSNI